MNSRGATYTVGIIGAGRIGATFDAPDSAEVLTHAHAVVSSPQMKLVGFLDADAVRGRQQAARWHARYTPTLEAFFSMKSDIVVIATPDETHASLLQEVLAHEPKLVIAEKPVTVNQKDVASLRKSAAQGKSEIIVNFSRRFLPAVRNLRETIEGGAYGKVITASGIYTKGIFHTGSHLIDLCRYFFGEVTAAQAFARVDDCSEGTLAGILRFERCEQFALVAGDARAYEIFEMDILTEKKRIRLTEQGATLELSDPGRDPLYPQFTVLGTPQREPSNPHKAMQHLYRHAAAILDGREESQSSLENALTTENACRKMAESFKNL